MWFHCLICLWLLLKQDQMEKFLKMNWKSWKKVRFCCLHSNLNTKWLKCAIGNMCYLNDFVHFISNGNLMVKYCHFDFSGTTTGLISRFLSFLISVIVSVFPFRINRKRSEWRNAFYEPKGRGWIKWVDREELSLVR